MKKRYAATRILSGLVLAGAAMTASIPVFAQSDDYPNKPIRLLVGFAPGGGADSFMRVMAKSLTQALNNSVVVMNYAGANGSIATTKAAHSAPDGYTLLHTSVPSAVNATLYDHLDYNPAKDFSPVVALASVPMVLTVPASSPYHTLQELIAGAKAKPGQLSYSSGGVGSLEHLASLALAQAANIQITHVPYKGSGASMTDLLAGRISFAFNSMPSVLPNIKTGNLRALAVADVKRLKWLPDTPSMVEAGLSNYAPQSNWFGVVVPAGTPKPIITRLNTEMNRILGLPEVKDVMDKMGAVPMGGTPEAFGKWEADETAKYAQLIKAFDLHPTE